MEVVSVAVDPDRPLSQMKQGLLIRAFQASYSKGSVSFKCKFLRYTNDIVCTSKFQEPNSLWKSMAPSGRTRTRKAKVRTTARPTTTQCKKQQAQKQKLVLQQQQQQPKNNTVNVQKTSSSSSVEEDHLPSTSSTISSDNLSKTTTTDHQDGYAFYEGVDIYGSSSTPPPSSPSSSSGCSTPKAERFRIPEIVTCPPAPKKQRVMTSSNCSLHRTPIAFYAPPDLELFFFCALRDISV
ncbi:hypothetical protein Q3G72_026552 [Acer saccharum]|nr:hypothetical protein Q3G72_026552 [Acer saccharum]